MNWKREIPRIGALILVGVMLTGCGRGCYKRWKKPGRRKHSVDYIQKSKADMNHSTRVKKYFNN